MTFEDILQDEQLIVLPRSMFQVLIVSTNELEGDRLPQYPKICGSSGSIKRYLSSELLKKPMSLLVIFRIYLGRMLNRDTPIPVT